MGGSRSELSQPVAGLFSTPRPERQRRALPLLRQLRREVAGGAPLLGALSGLDVCVEREFARFELMQVVRLFGLELEPVDRWGDITLRLWLVDRALRDCCELRVHRGGHFVTARRIA